MKLLKKGGFFRMLLNTSLVATLLANMLSSLIGNGVIKAVEETIGIEEDFQGSIILNIWISFEIQKFYQNEYLFTGI